MASLTLIRSRLRADWLCARVFAALAAASLSLACGSFKTIPRTSPLVPDGSPSILAMDFSSPIVFEPPSDGWYHRVFSTSPPMDIAFVERDGRAALRLATSGSASMLYRFVDIPLDAYSQLRWEWLIEQAIESELDERTSDGDDHPARLYLKFMDSSGDDHSMEIIWGNEHLAAGEWLHLTFFGLFSFPHYVANGGAENVGRWIEERVDLGALYEEEWGDPAGVRLVELALFCDTDQTGADSIAYFSGVRVEKR